MPKGWLAHPQENIASILFCSWEMQLVVLLLSRDRCLLPGLTRRRTLAQLGSSLSWEAGSWESARNCFLNPFPAVVCHCPQREVTRSSLSSQRLCKGPKSKYRVCHGPFCHCITVWHSSPSALQFFPPAEQYYCPLFIAYQIFLTYISRIEAMGRLPSVAMLFFVFCPFFFSLTCCKIWLGWNQHRHPLSNFCWWNIGFIYVKLQDMIDLNVCFCRACALLQYPDVMGSN